MDLSYYCQRHMPQMDQMHESQAVARISTSLTLLSLFESGISAGSYFFTTTKGSPTRNHTHTHTRCVCCLKAPLPITYARDVLHVSQKPMRKKASHNRCSTIACVHSPLSTFPRSQ